GVGTLTLLFSLGSHFMLLNEFMFHYMPYFNKFRTPEMWLIVTVFCYSVLAVYGLEALLQMARNNAQKKLLMTLGMAIALGAIFVFGSDSLLSLDRKSVV